MFQSLQFPSSVRGCLQCVTTYKVDNTMILVMFGRRSGFMVSVLVFGSNGPGLRSSLFLSFSFQAERSNKNASKRASEGARLG